MTKEKALMPVEQKQVLFYEDEITAVLVRQDQQYRVYVPVRPICDYLGISWAGQRERIERDAVLHQEVRGVRVTRTPGAGGG
ncbi:MAG: phage antirepressor N-terminal domain-containing protein, partial [Anaerolineae bacterium]